MSRISSPHRNAVDIASATGLAVATVRKYYKGASIREANRRAIERACAELAIPTFDAISADELDPRTFEG